MATRFLKHKGLYEEFKTTSEYTSLNKKQKEFFKAFFSGRNVFLTGAAGTGKSFCLTVLFGFLAAKGVFVGKSALTGVAALNIGGSTIHSWAGMGLADEDVDSVVEMAMNNKKARGRIQGTSVLFVDEISMASADLLDKLNAVLRAGRMSREPFGGIQVIFSGDFLQLPPVFKAFGTQQDFAFNALAWSEAKVKTVELEELVRQKDGSEFGELLQRVRFGDRGALELLESRVNAKLDTKLEPIKVFCKNLDIDRFNNARYGSIIAQEQVYTSRDSGDPRYSAFFDKNCPAPTVLRLKPGTQVMLLHNLEVGAGLVNGAMGKIMGFSPLGPIVEFTNGEKCIIEPHKWEIKEQELDVTGKMRYKTVAARNQVPLKLAWATSVHKQQGSTLDHAVVDVSNAFECGQVYVALSRVKTLEGLSLVGFNPNRIKAHPDCLDFYARNSE